MSQYYRVGDTVLWNPSMTASRLFVGQVRLFETELGLPSGVGPMQADECQVDLALFETFAQALVADSRWSHHAALRTLAEGFIVTVLAVAQRAGVDVRWPTSVDTLEGDRDLQVLGEASPTTGGILETDLRARAEDLERFLAR